MTIQAIIIFLLILLTLVVVHELGHFLFAKYFKLRVDEFAFGFPPTLLQKKIGETVYSFNLIPLGGYVKIFGENGLEDEEKKNLTEDDKKRLFENKPAWKRILVLTGGVLFNIIAAAILFSISLMYGSQMYLTQSEVQTIDYKNREIIIVGINEKSPFVGTGISSGDKILSFKADGKIVEKENLNSKSVSEFIQEYNNSQIEVTFKNKLEEIKSVSVIPRAGIVSDKKILGASFADTAFRKLNFIESIQKGAIITYEQLISIFTGLYELLKNIFFKGAKVEDNLAGPVGLAIMTSKVAEKGFADICIFAAMLSLSLAAFNILPIPALDGGRIFFVLLEVIFRRKIQPNIEKLFHGFGFLALLILMVFVTYFDIVKSFTI